MYPSWPPDLGLMCTYVNTCSFHSVSPAGSCIRSIRVPKLFTRAARKFITITRLKMRRVFSGEPLRKPILPSLLPMTLPIESQGETYCYDRGAD